MAIKKFVILCALIIGCHHAYVLSASASASQLGWTIMLDDKSKVFISDKDMRALTEQSTIVKGLVDQSSNKELSLPGVKSTALQNIIDILRSIDSLKKQIVYTVNKKPARSYYLNELDQAPATAIERFTANLATLKLISTARTIKQLKMEPLIGLIEYQLYWRLRNLDLEHEESYEQIKKIENAADGSYLKPMVTNRLLRKANEFWTCAILPSPSRFSTYSLLISSCDQYVCIVDKFGNTKIIDISDGNPKSIQQWIVYEPDYILGGYQERGDSPAAFHPSKPFLAIAFENFKKSTLKNKIIVWDYQNNRSHFELDGGDKTKSLSFSPDGSLLICSEPHIVTVIDFEKGIKKWSLPSNDYISPTCVSCNGDTTRIAIAYNNTIAFYDTKNGQFLSTFPTTLSNIRDIAFNPNPAHTNQLAVTTQAGVFLANIDDNSFLPLGKGYAYAKAIYSHDGTKVAVNTYSRSEVGIWETNPIQIQDAIETKGTVQSFSKDNSTVAILGESVKTWDTNTKKLTTYPYTSPACALNSQATLMVLRNYPGPNQLVFTPKSMERIFDQLSLPSLCLLLQDPELLTKNKNNPFVQTTIKQLDTLKKDLAHKITRSHTPKPHASGIKKWFANIKSLLLQRAGYKQ